MRVSAIFSPIRCQVWVFVSGCRSGASSRVGSWLITGRWWSNLDRKDVLPEEPGVSIFHNSRKDLTGFIRRRVSFGQIAATMLEVGREWQASSCTTWTMKLSGILLHINDQSFMCSNQLNGVIYMREVVYPATGHQTDFRIHNGGPKFGS